MIVNCRWGIASKRGHDIATPVQTGITAKTTAETRVPPVIRPGHATPPPLARVTQNELEHDPRSKFPSAAAIGPAAN